jgi:hypothetical protein
MKFGIFGEQNFAQESSFLFKWSSLRSLLQGVGGELTAAAAEMIFIFSTVLCHRSF